MSGPPPSIRLSQSTRWEGLARPLRAFLETESSGALVLLAATLLGLAWANSPFSESYDSLWSTELAVNFGSADLSLDLRHWVNDGLMVFFFFVVGLEIRRELTMGQLTDRRLAATPAIAAVMGLAVPALIYFAINPSGPAARGWGIPMGTDTAFMLGALAILSRTVSPQLRVFLLTLSIVDDIGAVLAMGVFYSESLSPAALATAAGFIVAIRLLQKVEVWRSPIYLVVAIGVWVSILHSGIHPAVAGVILGMLVRVRPPQREDVEAADALVKSFRQSPSPRAARWAKLSIEAAISPNERLQELLHPWTSFVVVPIFALANAGVALGGDTLSDAVSSRVTLGIVAGLVVGKFAGILLGTFIAVRTGLGNLLPGLSLRDIAPGAVLSGIGFTMSLFIMDLAFDDPEILDEARVGVLAASVLAVALGWLLFRIAERSYKPPGPVRLAPPVDKERDHIRGPATAPLELVEFGDFECPFCGQATGVVDDLRELFGDELRYVFRHLPLTEVHPHAELAAEAAEAAAAQGAFWPMHDLLFEHHDALELQDLVGYARDLGLDAERFERELIDREHFEALQNHIASAEASGVRGTPAFFVNGIRHDDRHDVETLSAALRAPVATSE